MLEAEDADRVPELVPLRHGRMLVSAFTFYRGAAAIMAADLAADADLGASGCRRCGDAHLSNFGAYAAADRNLVLDINDFDETLPGPWEWDLKRLVASFEIAGRDRGFGDAQRREIVLAAARTYREHMRELAELSNLDVWYQRLDVSQIREAFAPAASKKQRKAFDRNVAKTQRKDRLRAFSKLTDRVDGELRIVSDPPVLVPFEEIFSGKQLKTAAGGGCARCSRRTARPSTASTATCFDGYRYVHTARKVVGVGSVGTRAWVALFVGRDEDDPLFLQVKEAQPSVLEPYTAPTEFPHQGQRVVEGQRLTQAASDIMLGWMTAVGPDSKKRDFYVRQLWDQKGSALVETMSPRAMADLRADLRRDPRPRPRPLGRPDRDRRLPRQQRQLRPGDRPFRRPPTPTRTSATTRRFRPRSRTVVSQSSGRLIDGRPTLFGPLRVEKEGVQAI